MATRNVELLLLQNVENLGIVGDIVRVRTGYARNYLLPMQLAEVPTPERIEELKEARAAAELELQKLRAARADLLERLEGVSVTLVRSCNDKGHLYGSVTQRDIADKLAEDGHGVDIRAIRLSSAIRNIGSYDVPVQFDKELKADITVVIEPDQPLEEREEMEFDNEGNLIIPGEEPEGGRGRGRGRDRDRGRGRGRDDDGTQADADSTADAPAEGDAAPAEPAESAP